MLYFSSDSSSADDGRRLDESLCHSQGVGAEPFEVSFLVPAGSGILLADKLGFYLQVELPNWSYTIGKDEAMTQFLYNEFDRIVEAYGNHPYSA